MNPKTKAILEQVRILSQTYPDFVYADKYNDTTLCNYNDGGDSKYPELCGCIMGQAARLAGIDTSDWDVIPSKHYCYDTGIRIQIKNKLREDPYSPEADTLYHIQNLQDEGTPWGKAYAETVENQ